MCMLCVCEWLFDGKKEKKPKASHPFHPRWAGKNPLPGAAISLLSKFQTVDLTSESCIPAHPAWSEHWLSQWKPDINFSWCRLQEMMVSHMGLLTAHFLPQGKLKEVAQFCWFWVLMIFIRTLLRRRQWHPTPVLLPGKSHGWRSLVGCSPWGREESDMTELLHFHFSLSCIGEGNGNPLQCSCLKNPRDGGA